MEYDITAHGTSGRPLEEVGEAYRTLLIDACQIRLRADEFRAGYDIFKEAKVRRFWAQQPQSKFRPLLLKRLYPDIGGLSQNNPEFLAAFFGEGLGEVDSPWYSHAIRWRNNRRTRRFF